MARGRHRKGNDGDVRRTAAVVPEPRSPVEAEHEIDRVPSTPSTGWWSPLTQVLRVDVDAAAGQVNLDRDHYRLGEWVRWGQAMAAFTIDSPEDHRLVLHVV